MANNSLRTNLGRNVSLYRSYTANGSLSSTQYLPPTKFSFGVQQTNTPAVTSTDIDDTIPIQNGTINDDGSNTLTGSNGGDNTTNNTTTFKQGGGVSDVTAQNLIANGTNATKTWTISNLASAGTNIDGTNFVGFWLYIIDSAALAKLLSSGTAFELRLGSDTSNYYSKTWAASSLSVGWNWLSSNKTAVNALTETGTVSGDIDTFVLQATTNNASDTFSAGDLVYDMLRTWQSSDTLLGFDSGYPTFDYTTNEVTMRCLLNSLLANGFDVNALTVQNEDTSPLVTDMHAFTAESKTDVEEFIFEVRNRIL